MKLIPLNLLTLYADLDQNVDADTEPHGTVSRRKVGGKWRLYVDFRHGESRQQTYLGTVGDAAADALAARYRRAAAAAKIRRKTITTLKRAGFSAPDVATGRVVDAIARSGLFDRGAVLVGTVAFQTYPPLVGAFLSMAAQRTQDADLAATRLAMPHLAGPGPQLDDILQSADSSFAPRFTQGDQLPKRFASSRTGLIVELLTTLGRRSELLQVPDLGCAAIPLRYMEYLLENTQEVVVLYGVGVRIKVPDPARYAVHKLIVHQVRTNRIKAEKDLLQARELIEVYRARDPDHLEDAIEDAMRRGRTWAKLVRNGLKLVAT